MLSVSVISRGEKLSTAFTERERAIFPSYFPATVADCRPICLCCRHVNITNTAGRGADGVAVNWLNPLNLSGYQLADSSPSTGCYRKIVT